MSLKEFSAMGVVNVKDGNDRFDTRELSAVTNLAGEYGIVIESGDDYRVSAPSNWDPNDWAMAFWIQPDFDAADGNDHYIAEFEKDGTNRVIIHKDTSNQVRVNVLVGGTDNVVTLTPSWSAGDTVFVGLRLNGGTLTVYHDTNSDNTLETGTDASVGTYASSSGWTVNVGQDSGHTKEFEGAINALITDDGSSDDAIQDRFNSGNGMALEDWLATVNDGGGGLPHSENLVLHVGGNSDGSSVQLDTFAGATQLLSDPDDGGYDFPTGGEIDFGNSTILDGTTDFSVFLEVEIDNTTAGRPILARWSTDDNAEKQLLVEMQSTGELRVTLATDLTGGSAYGETSALDSGRYLFHIRYDGGGAANADRLKISQAGYTSSTRSYGALAAETLTFSGTIPTSLTTPSTAVNLFLGMLKNAAGNAVRSLDGKIYDVRLNVNTALAVADLDAQELDQAYHDEWDHWWPLEGDANDQIGSLNGTINGATSVTDGRSLSGRFERYTRQGRYWFDGGDFVDYGNQTILDGTGAATFWGVSEIKDSNSVRTLFSRWGSANDQKQFIVDVVTSGKVRFLVATDLSGNTADARSNTALSDGDRFIWWVIFDGSGGTNSDRVKMGVATYDPATGTYGTPTSETLSFNGTIPSSLTTPTTNTDLRAAMRDDGSSGHFGGIDEIRLNIDTALSTATAEAATIYSRTDADWDHAWEFDGNANDAIGSLNGSVTGAQQVADGRQPKGLSQVNGGTLEVDRATDSEEGTYALRLSGADINDRVERNPGGKTAEQWTVLASRQKRQAGNDAMRTRLLTGDNGAVLENLSHTGTSYADVTHAERETTTGSSGSIQLYVEGTDTEGLWDDFRAYELATVSPSVATKQLPSRAIYSESKNGSAYPYLAVLLNKDEQFEFRTRDDLGNQEGPAGGDTAVAAGAHTVCVTFDGTTARLYVDGSLEATTAAITGDFANLDVATFGAIRLGSVAHFFDDWIGRWLYYNRALALHEIVQNHRALKRRYTTLPEA